MGFLRFKNVPLKHVLESCYWSHIICTWITLWFVRKITLGDIRWLNIQKIGIKIWEKLFENLDGRPPSGRRCSGFEVSLTSVISHINIFIHSSEVLKYHQGSILNSAPSTIHIFTAVRHFLEKKIEARYKTRARILNWGSIFF